MISRQLQFFGSSGKATAFGSLALLATMVWLPTFPAAAEEVVLISAQEAQLPTPPGANPVSSRGITRGPKVTLVSPAAGAMVKSPVDFKLKFESFNGAQVDASTFRMTYVKSPAVDLTPRVKPYVQASGIDVPQAALAAGDHVIKVDVTDTEGRTATTSFVLKVTQ